MCPQALWPVPQPAQGPAGRCHPGHHTSSRPGPGGEEKPLSWTLFQAEQTPPLPPDDRQRVRVFSCRVITGKFSAPFCLGHWLVLLPKQL